jgi:hypothetical protein
MSITPPLFMFTDIDGDRLTVWPTPDPNTFHVVTDCVTHCRPLRMVSMTMDQLSDFADAIRAAQHRAGQPAPVPIDDPCPFADL